MVVYKCELCNYNTHILTHYNKHLSTKKHLRKKGELEGGLEGNIEGLQNYDLMTQKDPQKTQKDPQKTQKDPQKTQNEPKEFQCDFCDSLFSSYAHKRRHELHRCKENRDYTALYKKEKKEWHKEKKELFKQIEKLIDKAGNNNITTTYNTQNNIVLNNYGKEDLEHITDSYKTKLLKTYDPAMIIPKLIKDIHFNDSVPENKNVVYPNKKENKLKVFKEGKWFYENKTDAINDLIDGKYTIIDEHYDEHNSELNHIKKHKYKIFRNAYDDNNKSIMNSLQSKCEYILLNNR